MLTTSPRSVALFVSGLAGLQLFAYGMQWHKGFRPFGPVMPTRVSLSWDMFATRIERCDVRWTPPIKTPAGTFGGVRDLTPPAEWDYVLDTIPDYRSFARAGCQYATGPTTVVLTCYTMKGTRERDVFDCR